MSTDIKIQKLNCNRCGNQHEVEIDFAKLTKGQKTGAEPVLNNFRCPDIAEMYRVLSFSLDTRVTIFNHKALDKQQADLISSFKKEWGELNFDAKLERYKKLNLSLIGIPGEYYDLLWGVISSYCCGLFYPAMTSCGALGERILNQLILKTRGYYKSSEHYKKIYRKQSFDQWDKVIVILKDWKVISNDIAELFTKLKVYRNDSIHYNDGYDFEKNSHDALMYLAQIIDKLFNYTSRKDLFWVFDISGEIWVRNNVVNDPFVKEFVLPHCLHLTPFCEPTSTPPIKGMNAPTKPLSDKEFIRIRKEKR
jgi:hypothetical protein